MKEKIDTQVQKIKDSLKKVPGYIRDHLGAVVAVLVFLFGLSEFEIYRRTQVSELLKPLIELTSQIRYCSLVDLTCRRSRPSRPQMITEPEFGSGIDPNVQAIIILDIRRKNAQNEIDYSEEWERYSRYTDLAEKYIDYAKLLLPFYKRTTNDQKPQIIDYISIASSYLNNVQSEAGDTNEKQENINVFYTFIQNNKDNICMYITNESRRLLKIQCSE